MKIQTVVGNRFGKKFLGYEGESLRVSVEEMKKAKNLYEKYKKSLVSDDGHICNSMIEVEIDNFLFENNIPHLKPDKSDIGEFYTDSKMYPDWIVDGIFIEYCGFCNENGVGLKFAGGYYETIKKKLFILRKKKQPFIFLFPDDDWKKILVSRFKHLVGQDWFTKNGY